MTVLVMLLATIGLVPAATIAVYIILPDFVGALPAFAVLLPGVIALGVAKVLSATCPAVGLPLPVAAAAVLALVVNVAANIVLIPTLGIIGASLASGLLVHRQHGLPAGGRLTSDRSSADGIPGTDPLRGSPPGHHRKDGARPARPRPWRRRTGGGMTRRVLVLTYFFPPIGGVGVQRR